MTADFKKRQIDFLVQLIAITLVLLGIHSYLLYHFAKEIVLFFPIWHIYTFHFVMTVIIYSIVNYRFSNGHETVFNTFMIGTLLKMVLTIVFFLPLILAPIENKKLDLFNFIIPYFLYLFFEVYSIIKFIQNKPQ